MSLKQDFAQASNKKLDQIIKQNFVDLNNDIHRLSAEIVAARNEKRAVDQWYRDNLFDLVEDATSGVTLRQQHLAQEITIKSAIDRYELRDVASLKTQYEALYEAHPTPHLGDWLLGNAKAKRLETLKEIESKGRNIRESADALLQEAQQQTENAKDYWYKYVQDLAAFKTGLISGVKKADADIIKKACAKAANLQRRDTRQVVLDSASETPLLKAIAGEKDAFKEAETVAAITAAIEDPETSLHLLQNAMNSAQDNATKDRLKNYRNALSGMLLTVGDTTININHIGKFSHYEQKDGQHRVSLYAMFGKGVQATISTAELELIESIFSDNDDFIEVGNDYLVNVNHIGKIYSSKLGENDEKTRLYLRDMHGKGVETTLPTEEAEAIIAKLAEEPQFIRAGEYLVNMNHIGKVYNSKLGENDEKTRLYLRDMHGKGVETTLPTEQAEAIIAKLAEEPQFIEVGEYLVNKNHIGKVSSYSYGSDQSKKRVYLYDMHGKGIDPMLPTAEADALIEELAEEPQFIRAGDYLVNTNHIGKVSSYSYGSDKSKKRLYLHDMHGKGIDPMLPVEDVETLIDALAEEPQFIRAGDYLVNTHHAAKMSYGYSRADKKRLYLHDINGKGAEINDTAEATSDIVKQVTTNGQKFGLLQHAGESEDAFHYALQRARAWEKEQKSQNHIKYEDALGQLPVIIAGAINEYHNDPAAAQKYLASVAPAQPAKDDKAAAGQKGIKADFTESASYTDSLAEMEADRDMAIASFAKDYSSIYRSSPYRSSSYNSYNSYASSSSMMSTTNIATTIAIGVAVGIF